MKIVYHTLLHTSRVLGAPAVFLLLLLAITTTTHAQERPFITTWSDDVDEEGIPITIRLDGAFTYDFEYTLKDAQGSIVKSDRHTSGDGDFVITLPVRGATYTLEITGAFPRLFDYPKDRLLDVNQWGDIAWGSMRESFQDWPGEEFSAADAPDLSGVRDMSGMFSYYNIDEFTFNGDLSSWDVSNVTDMTYMFLNAESFNGDVRSWDVSNVTDMEGMFYSASAFNGNLSSWDVSNVTNMQFMFYNARAFNGNLGSWDISSVTNMIEMLDISGLSPASYDSLLIGWAGQQVQQNVELGARGLAFCEGRAAREVLTSAPNNWQIADEGRGIACPFNEAVSFITTWQATEADRQIRIPLDGRQAYDFLFEWRDDRDSVVASGHRTSGTWVTTLPDAGVYTLMIDGAFPRFAGYDKAQLLDVNQWGKIAWKSMQNSFGNWSGTGFSATDVPDLSEVIHMGGAFQRTSNFTGGDLDRWDVSEVINMEFMFDGAVSFNDDISGWDVSNVTTMEAMFRDAKAFDQNLGGWNIGRVENMNAMLRNTALSIAHYDSLLIGWERQEVRPNVPFGAFGLLYCEGEEARNRLTSAPNNWSMVDRGQRCVDDPSALFITTWQTTENNQTIRIPLDTAFTYNFDYVWRNARSGSVQEGSHTSEDGDFRITLSAEGTYLLEITGAFPRFVGYPKARLQDVNQWGNIAWGSMRESFEDWPGERFSAADTPDLSEVTDMRAMFDDASSFNGDVSNWDVSNVTDMREIFRDASSFNGDISSWDVSNVTNMGSMFSSASSFNGDISSWDVSNVTNMGSMFSSA
ncbi:MAG: BspA family leucine-rich repeat surface protein, partial [Bacteroidota bacterium]